MKNLILTFAIMAGAGMSIFARDGRISNIQWTLTYANGRVVTVSNAYFEINGDQTRFTGSTGCNRMFGTVAVNDNQITFSNVGTTKMMCKVLAGSVSETAFLNAMDKAAKYAQSGDTLHVFDRNRRTVLRFKRLVKQSPIEPNRGNINVDDRKWVLETIKNRQTFVPIKGAFVNFNERKGSLGGDTSCNSFGGDYSTSRSTIKITDIISTMRACTEGNTMNVEREFLDGLRESDRYEIRDGRLFMYDGKRLMLTLRGEPKN